MVRSDRAEAQPPKQKPYSKEGRPNGLSRKQQKQREAEAPARYRPENEILVDVIFSAHSDGLMAILRRA